MGRIYPSNILRISVITKVASNSPYTATTSDYTILCNCTAGAITINLPTAVGIVGRIYNIKKIDSSTNAVTIDGNGAETIDGNETVNISVQYVNYSIQSDGTNWMVV